MGHTTSKGRGRDLNLGLWGSKKCSSQESAFPQLNAKILEGCGLRLFAASKCSPWPAPEKVTITATVLSQVVVGGLGRASKPLSRGTRILLWAERHTWWERLGWLGSPCWGELVRPGLSCSPRRWCVVWWGGRTGLRWGLGVRAGRCLAGRWGADRDGFQKKAYSCSATEQAPSPLFASPQGQVHQTPVRSGPWGPEGNKMPSSALCRVWGSKGG